MAPNLELAMLVAPWLRELTDRTTLLYNDRVRQPWYDDLVFVAVDTARAPEPRVFEALELLALLQCVDLEAWILVVSVVWGPDTLNEIIASKPDGFELACELTFSPGHTATIVQWCERVVVDGIEWTASQEYIHVRSELEAMLKASERERERERPRIQVHLLSELADIEDVLAQFEHVVALQSLRASTQAPYSKWPPLFQVVFLDAFPYWPDGYIASERLFLRLVKFASCGIEQSCLLVDDLRIDPTKASLCVPGLQLLLQTREEPKHAHVGVSDVCLGGSFSGQTIASLFSALLVSSSVDVGTANRDLIFETTADRTRFWRWFALAFFSDAATLPPGYMSISLNNLLDGDVASMRELLDSDDPMSFACFDDNYAGQRALPSSARWTTASRFALEQPQEATARSFENLFTCEPQQVCLVGDRSSDTSAWQAVLLPGWGLAWMPKTDIFSCDDRSPSSGPYRARKLNLVNMDDTSQPTTLELLAVIGRRLRSLSLGLLSTTLLLDGWLQQVVRHCPSLENLNVSSDARLQSLETLPRMFERPDCVLRRLTLENVAIQEAASIARFVECLGDPTHPMAKTLRRFSLTLNDFPSRLVGIHATVIAMLESNIWLQEFVLCVHFQANVAHEDAIPSREQFTQFDGAPIAVELAPLDPDRKRAFLGVVHTARSEDGTHSTIAPMQNFDAQVLSLIFGFAAPCETRRVVVEFFYEVDVLDGEAEEEDDN